jgi:hypothetical protein
MSDKTSWKFKSASIPNLSTNCLIRELLCSDPKLPISIANLLKPIKLTPKIENGRSILPSGLKNLLKDISCEIDKPVENPGAKILFSF